MTALETHEQLLAALEQERAAVLALLPRFSDAQWRDASRSDGWTVHDIVGHLSTATYGLARMVLGELAVSTALDPQTGWVDPDEVNEQLRRKGASLPREKVGERMASAFDQARRAIEGTPDLAAPGPGGSPHSKGAWLARIVRHVQSHRRELEELLGG
jgi:uncharacterized damage-inducible protein DinB